MVWTMTEPVSSPSLWGKLIAMSVGLLGTVAVIVGVEVWAHHSYGTPPPYDLFVRLNQCQLTSTESGALLDCHPGDAQDVVIPPKSPDRKRVVFFGGSSVRLPRNHGFPSEVARLLPDVEVLNLSAVGMGAANIARLSNQLDLIEPDLVVIYAGHNE